MLYIKTRSLSVAAGAAFWLSNLEARHVHGPGCAIHSSCDEADKNSDLTLFFLDAALYFAPRQLSTQDS